MESKKFLFFCVVPLKRAWLDHNIETSGETFRYSDCITGFVYDVVLCVGGVHHMNINQYV